MKNLTLPYDEYQSDLLDMRRQGFNQAIKLMSKLLQIPEADRLKFLEDNLDEDAHDIAEKLGIPVPKFTEADIPF